MSPTDTELESMFRQWWLESYPTPPGTHALMTHLSWGRWLLQQPQTVDAKAAVKPVALAERGPTMADTDERGRCWYGTTEGGSTLWGLQLDPVALADTHWLPYGALPDLEADNA